MINDPEDFQRAVERRRRARMEMIDNYPPKIRVLVHEYGLAAVKAIYDLGVKKDNQIRNIIETVLDEFSPTRMSYSSQGESTRDKRRSEEERERKAKE